MFNEIIDRILKSLDESLIEANYPKFSREGYKAHKIDLKNFHPLTNLNTKKKIAFIDGGNAEIIGSTNFSLNLIRVCYVIYQNNKKLTSKKFETLTFIQSINKNNEIYYKISFFGTKNFIELEEMSFNSFDHTLMLGINRVDIGTVINTIRRFAELKLAKYVSDNNLSDIIVLDGNLQSTVTNENNYLEELYKSCSKSNIILTAISKMTSLFTDNGNLLSVVLQNMSNLQSWFYYPIVDINNKNHRAEIFFVKLHNNSKHVFRFEIFNLQKDKAEEIISISSNNSIDPIFLGYPYGLVEADRLARVSNQEKESLKTMFLFKLKNKNIEKYLNSKNAHEILDKISF